MRQIKTIMIFSCLLFCFFSNSIAYYHIGDPVVEQQKTVAFKDTQVQWQFTIIAKNALVLQTKNGLNALTINRADVNLIIMHSLHPYNIIRNLNTTELSTIWQNTGKTSFTNTKPTATLITTNQTYIVNLDQITQGKGMITIYISPVAKNNQNLPTQNSQLGQTVLLVNTTATCNKECNCVDASGASCCPCLTNTNNISNALTNQKPLSINNKNFSATSGSKIAGTNYYAT